MSDLSFELTEFFQSRELRLKAALVFTADAIKEGFTREEAIRVGVETADELLDKLDETEK